MTYGASEERGRGNRSKLCVNGEKGKMGPTFTISVSTGPPSLPPSLPTVMIRVMLGWSICRSSRTSRAIFLASERDWNILKHFLMATFGEGEWKKGRKVRREGGL